uniref:Uncharacterized protein n=1 Tax=Podarcis muralis TaxID=64176 RepID=A0A670KJU0_PODMU
MVAGAGVSPRWLGALSGTAATRAATYRAHELYETANKYHFLHSLAAPYGGSLLIWIAMALDTPSPSPRAPSLPSLGQPPLLLIPRLRLARREPWERRDLPNVREGSLEVVSLL